MVSLSALVLCVASTVGANDVVLLDFSASWCGPCQKMEPVVRQMEAAGRTSRQHPGDRFASGKRAGGAVERRARERCRSEAGRFRAGVEALQTRYGHDT